VTVEIRRRVTVVGLPVVPEDDLVVAAGNFDIDGSAALR